MKYITKNIEETKSIAVSLARDLKPGDVLLLRGELGAGKTTFTQGLAEALRIDKRILSPTFVILRSYVLSTGVILNHIDLYRLSNGVDLENAGIKDALSDFESINVIEWPERLKDTNFRSGYSIHLKHVSDQEREIEVNHL